MISIAIRRCEAADAPRLDWSPHQHYRAHFEKQFARQHEGQTLILVAEDTSGLVGRVILDFTEGEPEEAWLYALAVREPARRQGVATALMRAAAQEAGQREARRIALTVAKNNHSAQAFYARLGFFRTGEDVSQGLSDEEGRVIDLPEARWILHWNLPPTAAEATA